MHVLVTGGGGFLGGAIVRQLLARGDNVRSFGRGEYPELAAAGVEVVRDDIADTAAVARACQGVDCVFHAAALAGVGVRREDYERANVLGTKNVLAGCRAAGVTRLVYTSSPSVVFAGTDQCGLDETAPLAFDWLRRQRAWYSYTKAVAEEIVLAGIANGVSCGLKTCALRPHLIWGAGDNHLIPRLISRAGAGRLRRVGDGVNLVDVCHVDNAAAAHLLAADALSGPGSSVAGRAYFISDGGAVNCWQWIDQLLAAAGLPPVCRRISFAAAWRIGSICEAVWRGLRLRGEPPMTRFLAAQLAKSHWFDISAARRDLGYKPAVSTVMELERLGAWLRRSPSPATESPLKSAAR